MQERILTPEQVAQILQIHQFTVLKLIKQGRLKASKLGRVYRIKESDVELFLEESSKTYQKTETDALEIPPLNTKKPKTNRKKPSPAEVEHFDSTSAQPADIDVIEYENHDHQSSGQDQYYILK